MKNTFILVVVASLVLAALTGGWYWYAGSVETEKAVLIDVTDATKLSVDRAELLQFLFADMDAWGSAEITINPITNVDYNKVYKSVLPARFPLLANPDDRQKDIGNFKRDIAKDLSAVLDGEVGKRQSSVYLPVVNEANRLAGTNGKRKVLIVYSDLAENSDSFSVYRPNDFQMLKANAEKVWNQMVALQAPNDLQGLTVYFVFQPTGSSDNDVFRLMSNLLAKHFELAGAKVFIGANLVTYK